MDYTKIDQALRRQFGAAYYGMSVTNREVTYHFDKTLTLEQVEAAALAAASQPDDPLFDSSNHKFSSPNKTEVTTPWQSVQTFLNSPLT